MNENTLKHVEYFLFRIFYEISWFLSSRSRLKMQKVKSLEELELGVIYYIKATPYNTSGFHVYWKNDDEDYDLREISISDSTLRGKNWRFVTVKVAKEKGYTFIEHDTYFIDDNYRINNKIPDFYSIKTEISEVEEQEWIRSHAPEEFQVVHANCGKDNISPRMNAITSRKLLKEYIEERGCLYKLIDDKMITQLESFGLYNSYDVWGQYCKS